MRRCLLCLLAIGALGAAQAPRLRFLRSTSAANPIPADRRIDWTYTGVPGGVPNRTTICATLSAGATAGQINTAISGCSSNGVVKLNAGTYNVTGITVATNNVTLRGAGAGATILKGCNIVNMGSGGNTTLNRAITAGGAKDATTITVGSTTSLSVNTMIELDRADDTGYVVTTQGGSRYIRQVNMITAINGTVLTLQNPLIWDFTAASGGQIKFYFSNTRLAGIEDLRLDHSTTSGCSNFDWYYCYACWLKGVESYKPSGYHLTMLGTLNSEIRDSYIHEAASFGSNNGGFAVYGNALYGSNSSFKFENNIFDKLFPAIELQNASSGGAMLYNYSYGSAVAATDEPVTWTFEDNHGPHDMMNLWEGNIGELFGADGYFGSSSHGTLFRSFITGYHPRSGNMDAPIRLKRLSYAYNIVGNVLGTTAFSAGLYEQTATCAVAAIYELGYPNIGNCDLTDGTGNAVPGGMTYPDAKVKTTLFRWGNYDRYGAANRFDSGEVPSGVTVPSSQVLPTSLYYTAKPAYFGALAWPLIGPDVTGGDTGPAGHANKNPAQLCWDAASLVSGGTFDRATCYP